MAKRTKLPLLRSIADLIIRKVAKYEPTIRKNAGDGVWFLVELLLAVAGALVVVLEENSDPNGNFQDALSSPSPAQINAVKAAVAAYKSAVGANEAW